MLFKGFLVFEIGKNLNLRKIFVTPKVFLKSRFHCIRLKSMLSVLDEQEVSTGCNSDKWKKVQANILKEPSVLMQQTIPQQKALDLSFNLKP